VIARFSPAQLRTWINRCDLEEVASYLEASFEENDDVWHDAQFEILVEMIPSKRLASFLEKNRFKLTEPHFRMVIEELDIDDTLSFWENHLPEPLGEKRRIAFRMAIGWINFQKLMQVWENHFLEMTVEEFYLVVERVHFFIKQCKDLYTHFAQFLQNHFPQLKDEQLCIMIRCSNALGIIRSDEKGENYFPHLTDKRLAIIKWEHVLNDYYSDGDVDIPLRYLTTDSMRRIVFRCEMDRVEKGTYEGNVMEYFGLLPSEWGNCGFYNLSHLTDEEFRTILEKADLEDVLSLYNIRSAELAENQRRIVAERLCKP
jgi:D-ribose pyranose/furanose isomerase RbsD